MTFWSSTRLMLAIAWLLWSPCAAPADVPASLAIEALPLAHVRDGRVEGCGLRLTGGEARAPVSSWFDVSLNVFRRGAAIVQSILYELRRSEFEGDSRPMIASVESTWVRAGEGITRRGENIERKTSLVYTVVSDDALAVFEAVAKGDPITVGVKRWGEASEAVYTGQAVLQEDAREQIGVCLGDLLEE